MLFPLFVLAVFALSASGVASNGIEWSLENGVLTVTGEGPIIKDTKYQAGVAGMQDGVAWIGLRNEIISANIGHGITEFPVLAFDRFRNLKTLSLPDTLEKIGVSCFFGCTSLSSITIDPGNPVFTSVNNCLINKSSGNLVVGCHDSVIPTDGSVTSIGLYAFMGREMTSFTIPSSVNGTGSLSFMECAYLKEVTLENGVREIGGSSFKNCISMETITIPLSVSSIGVGAFEGCSSLTDIYYAGTEEQWNWVKVERLNQPLQNATVHFAGETPEPLFTYTFEDGTLTLNGVGKIDNSIIWNGDSSTANRIPWTDFADDVEHLVVGHGITSIPYLSIFKNLKTLTLSDTVERNTSDLTAYYVQSAVFESVTVDAANPYLSSVGGCLVDKSTKTLVLGGSESTIPSDGSVEIINKGAFAGRKDLSSVAIPSSVSEIGDEAFKCCTALTTVTIPSSVKRIGDGAFDGCSSLVSLSIPEGVENIGSGAFSFCTSLSSVDLPASLTTLGAAAFTCCEAMSSLTFKEGIRAIPNSAFSGCTSLWRVVFPDSVISFGDMAFCACTSLREIVFGRGVVKTGYFGFANCTSLERVYFPSSLITAEQYSFYGCESLTDIFYGGDEARWNRVIICDGNSPLYSANIHYAFPLPTVYVGDVNGDGLITIQDLGNLKNILSGTVSGGVGNCDMNGDGLYTISDLSIIKKLLAG